MNKSKLFTKTRRYIYSNRSLLNDTRRIYNKKNTIAPKRIKYLGTNLTKVIKDLYAEKCKTC